MRYQLRSAGFRAALAMALAFVACDNATIRSERSISAPSDAWYLAQDAPFEARVCSRSTPPADNAREVLVELNGAAPCVFIEQPVSTILTAGVNDSHPAPSYNVVRASDGSFFSTGQETHAGLVLHWSADGTFLRQYGRRGDGPGEFSGVGDLILVPDAADSLFVIDDRNTWSVFDDSLRFSRSFRGLHSTRAFGALRLMPQRLVLSAGPVPTGDPSNRFFRLMDLNGAPIDAFGESGSGDVWRAWPGLGRRVAIDGDTAFWVAPIEGHLGTSALELWSLDGAHQRSLRRRASWLPSNGYAQADAPSAPALPFYGLLHVDAEGLLWVVVTVRDEAWRSPEELARLNLPPEDMMRSQYETMLEVVDPRDGSVLASVAFDSPQDVPFINAFPGTRSFYRVSEDSLGFHSVEIFEVELASR